MSIAMVDLLFLHLFINKLYYRNFGLYKRIYFIYKNLFERKEINFIEKNLKPGSRVIDIGANVGFYTLLFSRLVGKTGKVYAFEPEKNNFRNLKKLCNKRKNVVLNNLAVGEKAGNINLYVSDKLNVDHCTFDNHEKRDFSVVKCISIDEYLGRDKKIDFIKIDTQGFEYKILLGMEKTLHLSENVILLCEVAPEGLKNAGASVNKLYFLLRKWGFKIRRLDTNSLKNFSGRKVPKDIYTNIIASRSL